MKGAYNPYQEAAAKPEKRRPKSSLKVVSA